jgi:hypothetical protein
MASIVSLTDWLIQLGLYLGHTIHRLVVRRPTRHSEPLTELPHRHRGAFVICPRLMAKHIGPRHFSAEKPASYGGADLQNHLVKGFLQVFQLSLAHLKYVLCTRPQGLHIVLLPSSPSYRS